MDSEKQFLEKLRHEINTASSGEGIAFNLHQISSMITKRMKVVEEAESFTYADMRNCWAGSKAMPEGFKFSQWIKNYRVCKSERLFDTQNVQYGDKGEI